MKKITFYSWLLSFAVAAFMLLLIVSVVAIFTCVFFIALWLWNLTGGPFVALFLVLLFLLAGTIAMKEHVFDDDDEDE